MKNRIKNFLNYAAFTTGAVILFAAGSFAQNSPTTGTAQLNITVAPSVQLTSFGTASVSGSYLAATSTNAASGNAINMRWSNQTGQKTLL